MKVKFEKFSVWLVLLLALFCFTFQIIGFDLSYLPGDLGDARFNNYLLEHNYKYITLQLSSYWDAPFFFPEKEVISISDNLIGTSPFYSLFRIIGFDRETSFQLWFIQITILNYITAFYFLKFLFKNRYAAILGAFIFAFSIGLSGQLTHAQCFTRFPIPLAFWSAINFLQNFKTKYFFITLLLVVYQFYCVIYLGFMLAIPIAAIILYSFFIHYRIIKPQLIRLLSSAAISSVTLLPLMIPYIDRADLFGLKKYAEIKQNLPTIYSYFFIGEGSLYTSIFGETGKHLNSFWNHYLFTGFIPLLSILLCVIIAVKKINERDLNKIYLALLVSALVTFVIFFRIGDFSLYKYIFTLPGFGSMRALQRIINIEIVYISIAIAVLYNWLLKRFPSKGVSIFLLFISFLLIDNYKDPKSYTVVNKKEAQKRINSLVGVMSNIPLKSVISYEPLLNKGPIEHKHLDAMLATQQLNLKCINGYSAMAPKKFYKYWKKPDEFSRNKWLEHTKYTSNIYVIK